MPKPFLHDIAGSVAFDDLDVARCYVVRPPYAAALYERLLSLTPRRAFALDIACGTGKIARELAPYFDTVAALDQSARMIEVGRELAGDSLSNIGWDCRRAEDADFDGQCDLITIGTAVSWLQHDIVFPKFAGWLALEGVFAVISGDDGFDPPWARPWREFLTLWLARLDRQYDPAGFQAVGLSYVSWMDIVGEEGFTFSFEQSIEEFVTCQHSRATWTRARMGTSLAAEFDEGLRNMLEPFADNGLLRYPVRSTLVWGRPRTVRREVETQ